MSSSSRAPPELVPSPPGAQVIPAELPGMNSLLALAVGVVVVAALYFGRPMLIPVTLAVLLSFLLAPLAGVLRRIGLPRTPAVLLAVLLALAVTVSLAAVIGMQIASLSGDTPQYQAVLQQKMSVIRETATEGLDALQAQFGVGGAPGKAAPAPAAHGAPAPKGTAQNPVSVQVEAPRPTPLGVARRILGPVLEPLATMALVMVIAVFVLLQKDDLRDRLIRLFGSADLHRTTLAMNDAARRLSKYFLAQLAINAGFGAVITAGLAVLGVPSPVLWGMMATLLRFVPYIGVYIAASFPLLLAAAVFPGWAMAGWTLGLFLVCELIVGQVVEPFAYGHSTGLSPVSVVVSALFWTWIWGPVGLLLATPLTLCLVVLGRHVKRLEFLDVLLGDRPALTPVESLYQRMLAHDPDEAAAQAEALLRERALSVYYDEVGLRAVLMAANDARRGVLTRERQLRMRDALCELVDALEEAEDVSPQPDKADDGAAGVPDAERAVPKGSPVTRTAPPDQARPDAWRGEAVLCIGGRGPLDDAAACMMAQLMGKHGLGARIIRHEAVSRSAIDALEVGPVGAICVSYAEATGSSAHLRFLLRRLRQKAPDAALILGFWVSETPASAWDPAVLGLADGVAAGTLREVLGRCLDAVEAAVARGDDMVALAGE